MKWNEKITFVFYFSYIAFIIFLIQKDSTIIQFVSYNPLLDILLWYKPIFFGFFPLIGSMLVSDIMRTLKIHTPIRELGYLVSYGILASVTYLSLLLAYHIGWAIIIAVSFGLTTFVFSRKRPDLAYSDDAEYLSNYELIKKVIAVSTVILLLSSSISLGRFETISSYLSSPAVVYLLLVLQFTLTVILLVEIITILIIYSDREYALRLSKGHIQSITRRGNMYDADVSRAIITSLNFYNRYVERSFGVKIVAIERLYEYILLCSPVSKTALLVQFNSSFKIGKLDLLIHLRQLITTGADNRDFQFLSKNFKRKHFGEFINIVIPIVAVLISIMDLISK